MVVPSTSMLLMMLISVALACSKIDSSMSSGTYCAQRSSSFIALSSMRALLRGPHLARVQLELRVEAEHLRERVLVQHRLKGLVLAVERHAAEVNRAGELPRLVTFLVLGGDEHEHSD